MERAYRVVLYYAQARDPVGAFGAQNCDAAIDELNSRGGPPRLLRQYRSVPGARARGRAPLAPPYRAGKRSGKASKGPRPCSASKELLQIAT